MAETENKSEALEKSAVAEASVNTQADAPKKNAVAAETSKLSNSAEDLGPAVVKPTDSNPDATKKTKQVSGDPQQKSQGSADAMPKLKEEEVEAEGSEIKEGEMPKAALDALNKSKDKEVKEVADKEDEKKKEVSEIMDKEKEVKKETAKDKVKDMDMKEDVAALTEGEDLSEEFKAKAATIFEASIKAKLVEEIENLESEYETKVNEKVEETKSEIVEKVDAYLNYVVEEWMKENELAIEKGLRAEITEDFIGGLKSLFESHYINVPQEKYDVIEAQTAEIEKLKEEVNSTIEKNVELNQAIGQHVRTDIINDVTSDLAETETEKLKGLAEGIEYKDADSFRKSVETLKNSYYPKAKASDTESNEVAENNAGSMNESMAAYTAAISKSKKNPYVK